MAKSFIEHVGRETATEDFRFAEVESLEEESRRFAASFAGWLSETSCKRRRTKRRRPHFAKPKPRFARTSNSLFAAAKIEQGESNGCIAR